MSARKILTETKKKKAKRIDNYYNETLVLGKWYWTYFYFPTNKGNKFKDYLGVFRARPVKITSDKKRDDLNGKPKRFVKYEWEVADMKFPKVSAAGSVQLYLNGYGLASCDYWESEEDCIEAHNKDLKEFARGLNTTDRESILSRLINEIPKMSKIEAASREWIKTLDKTQRKYLRWVKEYYEDEI